MTWLDGSAATLVIAPVIGAYLCLSAIGLLRAGAAARFYTDIAERPAAMHATGAVALLAGAAVLSMHRTWSTPAEIAVGIAAAWWCIEGAGLVADPVRTQAFLVKPAAHAGMRKVQFASLAVGLYLLAVGLFGTASA